MLARGLCEGAGSSPSSKMARSWTMDGNATERWRQKRLGYRCGWAPVRLLVDGGWHRDSGVLQVLLGSSWGQNINDVVTSAGMDAEAAR